MSPCSLSLLLAIVLLGVCQCQPNCSFSKLVDSLKFPNSSFRPVKNWKSVTNVTIDLTLYTVINLDTSLQTLTTLIWFDMAWKNEFINWNPESYCSIEKVLLTGDNLWKPDLYVYEMTENSEKSPVIPYYTIDYTGKIISAKPMQIVSSCHLNIFKFPFDTQTCKLTFGSYIHPVANIVMYSRSNSSQVFHNSSNVFASKGDWVLVNIKVVTSTITSGEVYSTVSYEITLKRMPVVYVLTLIIPACFMVILDIISIFIRNESGERLGFKITIVLGFSVLLLILNNMLPTSNIAPALGIFCIVCMALMMSSIVGSTLVSYMLYLSENQVSVPFWIRIWVTGYLARALCFKEKSFRKYGIDTLESETYVNKRSNKTNLENKKKTTKDSGDSLEVKLLKRLLMQIVKIHEELINSRNKVEVKTEWHAAALVVDRLVLFVYLITVISLFIAVLVIWMA